MKKYSNLILIVLMVFTAYLPAKDKEEKRTAPNYKQIEKAIKKKSSNLYYSKLMERFEDADPSMTLEEKRHLYYGYIFQDSYSAYGEVKKMTKANELMNKRKMKDSDMQKVIDLTDKVLEEDPLYIRALEYQLYMYSAMDMEDTFEYEKVLTKLRIIVSAISSSGDGLSKKTAFYVIRVPDEYFMLTVLGYEFGGSQSLIEHFDYLEVEKNDDKVEGLYFDISPSLNSLENLFK